MRCPVCGSSRSARAVSVRRGVSWACFGVAIALGAWIGGSLLHDVAEGVDRARLPFGQLLWPLAFLLLGVIAALVRVTRPTCELCRATSPSWLVVAPGPFDAERRRSLWVLAGAGTAVAGFVGAAFRNREWAAIGRAFFGSQGIELVSPQPRPEWDGARIRAHRRLGRTNVLVSDISVGGGRISDVDVARLAIERGVTYFDTSPDYADTRSERVIGEAIRGRRDQVFIATKFCRPTGHLMNDTPVPEIIRSVEESLGRLQTDRVDLIHIHACDSVDRLLAPNVHEAFDRLKEQGKVRFLGVSTHTPNLEAVANAAIDSGRFDVMMLAYHFGMWKSFGAILDKAAAHDVGVVAMKTLKGAKHTNLAQFRDEASAYSQAAFRWVLSNPAVSCLVVSFWEPRQVDEYLVASGTGLRPGDVALLERYDVLTAGDYCQPHCGVCLGSCPEKLPIHDVLRYRMYARDYGWPAEGRRLYAALDRNASLCASCPAPCAGTCPIGVPIREKMLDADRLLTA